MDTGLVGGGGRARLGGGWGGRLTSIPLVPPGLRVWELGDGAVD